MSVRQGFLVSWADSPEKYRAVFEHAADTGFDYSRVHHGNGKPYFDGLLARD